MPWRAARERPAQWIERNHGTRKGDRGKERVRVKGCVSVYIQRACGRNSDKYIEVFQRNWAAQLALLRFYRGVTRNMLVPSSTIWSHRRDSIVVLVDARERTLLRCLWISLRRCRDGDQRDPSISFVACLRFYLFLRSLRIYLYTTTETHR